MEIESKHFWVQPDKPLKLNKIRTIADKDFSKEKMQKEINETVAELKLLQEKLFADHRYAVLIIFQAMDAAGKDGAINHVMSGLNPQGVNVASFKHPSAEEYNHDFFWRFNRHLPEQGTIGIFNRSYYENSLICKVHPELILNEKLPCIRSVKDINNHFWNQRVKQMKRYEKNLHQEGTIILKFYLHISKDEQLQRLKDRINDPSKHYKFNYTDIEERGYWNDYMKCYEEILTKTSTPHCPWFLIPADDKWYARAAIANIVKEKLQELNLKSPVMGDKEIKRIKKALDKAD
ncbi:MAG: polyphosphate kinase 2 family protein [Bacteroidia bacterium]|nr:polyphosphate kinase 2 family protein [Bacteroidia bacterium]